MLVRFKNCAKCNGDLTPDEDEWRCWQCGTYYYPNEPVMDLPREAAGSEFVFNATDCEVRPRRVRGRRRTMPHINSLIIAKERSESRWWAKNQDIVDRLKQGYSVRRISELVGKGERQIRGVQERLKDKALTS